MRFRGIGWYPDGCCLEDERSGEGQGDLKFVPTPELDPIFHRNVKAENRRARFSGEDDWALLSLVTRTSWSINSKCDVAAAVNGPTHFRQRFDPAR